MIATIGYRSLLLALALAAWGVAVPVLGARTVREAFFASARGAILGKFALVTLAGPAPIYTLVTTDFSLKYVALNTTRATPLEVARSASQHLRHRPFTITNTIRKEGAVGFMTTHCEGA